MNFLCKPFLALYKSEAKARKGEKDECSSLTFKLSKYPGESLDGVDLNEQKMQ